MLVVMKLNLVYLFPYKFTEYSFYKFEISKLSKDKNINPIIHDLSEILGNEKLNLLGELKLRREQVNFIQ